MKNWEGSGAHINGLTLSKLRLCTPNIWSSRFPIETVTAFHIPNTCYMSSPFHHSNLMTLLFLYACVHVSVHINTLIKHKTHFNTADRVDSTQSKCDDQVYAKHAT